MAKRLLTARVCWLDPTKGIGQLERSDIVYNFSKHDVGPPGFDTLHRGDIVLFSEALDAGPPRCARVVIE